MLAGRRPVVIGAGGGMRSTVENRESGTRNSLRTPLLVAACAAIMIMLGPSIVETQGTDHLSREQSREDIRELCDLLERVHPDPYTGFGGRVAYSRSKHILLEELPDAEVIIVPVGGGSGASGTCIVAKAVDPAIQVVGCQAEKAPAWGTVQTAFHG